MAGYQMAEPPTSAIQKTHGMFTWLEIFMCSESTVWNYISLQFLKNQLAINATYAKWQL